MSGRRAATIVAVVAVVVLVVVLRFGGGAADEEELPTDVAVHVTPIGRATLRQLVTAYGQVEPAPANGASPAGGAMITPFVDGVVAFIDAVEGQDVARGDVLVRLDSRLAEVAVESAQQQADFAEQAFQRQESLLATDGTSQRAYQEARQLRDAARSALASAQTDLDYRRIASPLTGFASVLAANLRNLAGVLNAVADQKQQTEGAA